MERGNVVRVFAGFVLVNNIFAQLSFVAKLLWTRDDGKSMFNRIVEQRIVCLDGRIGDSKFNELVASPLSLGPIAFSSSKMRNGGIMLEITANIFIVRKIKHKLFSMQYLVFSRPELCIIMSSINTAVPKWKSRVDL